MEFILILAAAIALLLAVLVWSRRGQSSINRESGDPGGKAGINLDQASPPLRRRS
jgi:hypothetical protein